MNAERSLFVKRMGMVLIAAAGDGAWGSAGMAGLKSIETNGLAQIAWRDHLPPEEWENAARSLVLEEGCDLVFGHGGELSEALLHTAGAFSQAQFACLNGAHTAENLAVLEIDDLQLGFLAGFLAARVSRTRRVGFVGGIGIAPTRRQAEGFILGAQAGGTDASAAYTGSFNDAQLAYQAAIAHIRQGADVLYYYLNEAWPGVLQACRDEKCRAIASVTDRHEAMPSVVCGSVLQHVDRVYLAAARLALAGKLKGRHYRFGLESGAGSLSALHNIPENVAAEISTLAEAMAAGKFNDQDYKDMEAFNVH